MPVWAAATTASTSLRVDTPMVTCPELPGASRFELGVTDIEEGGTPDDDRDARGVAGALGHQDVYGLPREQARQRHRIDGQAHRAQDRFWLDGTSMEACSSSPGRSPTASARPSTDGRLPVGQGRGRRREPHGRRSEVAGFEDRARAERPGRHDPALTRMRRAGERGGEHDHRGHRHQESTDHGPASGQGPTATGAEGPACGTWTRGRQNPGRMPACASLAGAVGLRSPCRLPRHT